MALTAVSLQKAAVAGLSSQVVSSRKVQEPQRGVSISQAFQWPAFSGRHQQGPVKRSPDLVVRATDSGSEPIPIWDEEGSPAGPVGSASEPLAAYEEAPSIAEQEDLAQEDLAPSDTDPAEEAARRSVSETFPEDVQALKQQFMDTVYGTDRGMRAGSETQAEIAELISQLENKNPTASPTQSDLLNGKWNLVYTSFSDLSPLLAVSNLPMFKIKNISQTIDVAGLTLENKVEYKGPVANNFFAAGGRFEVRSPQRIQVTFENATLGTPQLSDAAQFPKAVSLLGQQVDLSGLQSAFKPVQDAAQSLADNISKQPPLKVPIRNARGDAWLLTTYLDEDLRISRGSGGGVFVLVKEGSTLS